MPLFSATFLMTQSIAPTTLSQVVPIGTRISIVTLHFCGVTLWLEPPVISVRLQLIDLAWLSELPMSHNSFFIAAQKSYISSIEFLASQGALAWALFPTSVIRRIASLPL